VVVRRRRSGEVGSEEESGEGGEGSEEGVGGAVVRPMSTEWLIRRRVRRAGTRKVIFYGRCERA
jgi:hypothetical protein